MTSNLYKKWEECKEEAKKSSGGPHSQGVCYFPFSRSGFGGVSISVDSTGSESLYIQLDESTANSFERPNVAGLLFSIGLFPELDETNRFLKISLDSHSGLPEAFEAFSVTVARTIATSAEPADAIEDVLSIVGKYSVFFGKGGKCILTRAEEQGLFGELLVLEKVLSTLGDNAIATWTGPDRNKHDFIFDHDDAIEVKTSLRQTRLEVKISNENQLSFAAGSKLFLQLLTLEVNPNGQTLSELIKHINNDCIKTEGARQAFKTKLLEMGVEPKLLSSNRRYVLLETHTFRVNDTFPRLTIENIKGISSRIFNLTYRLDLNGYAEEEADIYECLRG